jgi:hypothetical protein
MNSSILKQSEQGHKSIKGLSLNRIPRKSPSKLMDIAQKADFGEYLEAD